MRRCGLVHAQLPMPMLRLRCASGVCIALWLCGCGSRVHMCQMWPALPRCGMPSAADSRQQGRLLLLAFALLCFAMPYAFLHWRSLDSALKLHRWKLPPPSLRILELFERLMLKKDKDVSMVRKAGMPDNNLISYGIITSKFIKQCGVRQIERKIGENMKRNCQSQVWWHLSIFNHCMHAY